MADVGVAPQPSQPQGLVAYQKLIEGGYSADEANQWKAQQTQQLLHGGFTPKEVDDYWGEGEAHSAALDELHKSNLGNLPPDKAQEVAKTPLDMLGAGWGMSVSGLALAGRKPDKVLPQDAPLYGKILAGAGQFAGDTPAIGAGFWLGLTGGTAAGAAVPGAGETGASEVVGGIVGAGAGAAALPTALREVMLDAYSRGEVHSFKDFMTMAGKSLLNTGKAAVAGAVSAPLGAVAGRAVGAAAGNAIGNVANATTQAAAYTAVGGALDGKVPDAQDFVTGAFLALGFHAAGTIINGRVAAVSDAGKRVQANLQTIYKQTGMTPWQAVEKARTDPVLRGEILGQDVNGDPVMPSLKRLAPPEPDPYSKIPPLRVPNEEGELPPKTKEGEEEAAGGIRIGAEMLPLIRRLESSGDQAVSPAGAIGRYQIMPGTARQYGYDAQRLTEVDYNTKVAATILNDLWNRYHGDASAVLIAYNAGPGVANRFLANGRDFTKLPLETQKYLVHAGQIGKGGGLPPSVDLRVVQGGEGAGGEIIPPGGSGGGKGPPPGGQKALPSPEGEEPHYTTEMLHDRVRDMIGEEKQPESVLNPARNYRQWVSELGPARAVDNLLIKQGYDRESQLGLEDIFRQTYASDLRAGVFVRRGGVTFDSKTGDAMVSDDPPIMKAIDAVKEDGGNLNDFVTYMLTQRAKDKEAQGFETGHPLTPEQRDQLLKDDAPKYARGMALWNKTMNAALKYGQDSGIFNAGQVHAMVRDNPAYISFRRIMGDLSTQPRTGKGFKVGQAVKTFEGDNRQIKDPILASIDNIHQIVRMADRNRAIGSAISLAEKNGILKDLGLTRIGPPKMEVAEPDSETFKPYFVGNAGAYEPFLAVKASRKSFSPNQFMFIRNGKPEMWEAKDPTIANLMRGADSAGEANVVMRLFDGVAKLQRLGIVTTPDFPTRVTLRHQVTAYILDPKSPPPFVTWLRGAMHAFKADDVYWRWVSNGGAGTALADLDADFLKSDMQKVFEDTGVWDRMWNTVRHPIEAAQILGERIDAAARIGYTESLRGEDISTMKAATMSRKAMLDYAERGTLQFAQWWARAVPFMRPHFLGLKQFGEAVTAHPYQTLAKAVTAITLPQVILYGLNYLQDQYGGLPEDRKYRNLPRYYKDGLYIMPEVGGIRLRLPVPFVIGVPFSSFVNRFLDHYLQSDPKAFDGWAQTVLAEFIPPFVPSLLLPPLEQIANKNFMTGKPLIPGSLEKASGPMQYTEATSEPAKALSRVLAPIAPDASPIVIDNYARQWGGTLGIDALRALNAPFSTNGRPWEVSDLPFLNSFVLRSQGGAAQPIQDFYDEKEKFDATRANLEAAKRRLRVGVSGAAKELQQSAEGMLPAQAPDMIAKAMSMEQAVIQGINNNEKMSDDEKRQATDAAYSNMIVLAKRGLQMMQQMKQAVR